MKGQPMKAHIFIVALIVTTAIAPAALAAPGDGVSQGCLKAFEDLAKRRKPDKFHAVRHKVCNCVQQRVKDDAKIDDASKDKVGKILANMVSDPKRSGDLRRGLTKLVNDQMRKHMGACNQ
jgi:hypothetical protein